MPRDARDHLARRVVGDVLVGPAGARRADRVELRQAGAQEARVLPFLQLVVVGVAIKAEPVRQQVADRRPIFVARGQLEVGRIIGDRRVEVDLALLGELGDHRRRDALRHRRPAEHRVRRHRLARAGERLAIALEEGDAAVLDHADGQPDHRRLGHQLPQARVEQPVIDVAARCGRQRRELAGAPRDRLRLGAGSPDAAASPAATRPSAGRTRRARSSALVFKTILLPTPRQL